MFLRAAAATAGLAMVAVLSASAGQAVPSTPQAIGRYSTADAAVPMDGLGSRHYLETVRGLLASVPHVEQPDADLVQGGKDICADVEAGATWASMIPLVDSIGGDREFYRVVVRAAVLSFCIDEVDALG